MKNTQSEWKCVTFFKMPLLWRHTPTEAAEMPAKVKDLKFCKKGWWVFRDIWVRGCWHSNGDKLGLARGVQVSGDLGLLQGLTPLLLLLLLYKLCNWIHYSFLRVLICKAIFQDAIYQNFHGIRICKDLPHIHSPPQTLTSFYALTR